MVCGVMVFRFCQVQFAAAGFSWFTGFASKNVCKPNILGKILLDIATRMTEITINMGWIPKDWHQMRICRDL